MATKKRPSKPSQTSNAAFRGFINYNLTDEDKAAIKRIEFSDSDVVSWLSKSVDSGFKVTFSYDNYNHCFQVIGTPLDRENVDYGVLLTGRGSTPAKAFRQWMYLKDTIIGDDDWSAWLTPNRGMDIDD